MSTTLIQAIAAKVEYLKRCYGNAQFAEYVNAAQEKLDKLIKHLPSGSGIDAGVKLDFERSNSERVVLTFDFHHMNDVGYYAGWTHHTAVVTPSFDGFNLSITGRDRNQIKDYLYDVFDYALRQKVDEHANLERSES